MMRHAAYALGVALAACVLAIALTACPGAWQALAILADKVDCGIRNQNLPNEEILRRCAVEPGDAKRVLDLVSAAREESALQANRAAAVQAEKDQRSGVCK